MSIKFQYKNTSLEELIKNKHFNLEELSNILEKCYELNNFDRESEIVCTFNQTAHKSNSFECEVLVSNVAIIRDGNEPMEVALNTCHKAVEVMRRKNEK